MMELLIIKAGDDYFRCREDHFEACTLSKASVFTLDEAAQARLMCRKLVLAGVVGPELKKLTIIEEPFDQE